MIPLRFADIASVSGKLLFTADTGRAFIGDRSFLDRYSLDALTESDRTFLKRQGLDVADNKLADTNYLYQLTQRHFARATADYFIVVPTLRCNLACSYCQVSRANLDAIGFDWTDEITERSIEFIAERSPNRVKVEFQGGEPTLRLDVVATVIDTLEARGKEVEAVICTNFSTLTQPLRRLLARENVYISTSIDGSLSRQSAQRTGSDDAAAQFFENVDATIAAYGPNKVSALPTINPDNPPTYDELYSAFAGRGLKSIFLRPINFHGFARKRHALSRERRRQWSAYYRGFINFLIDIGQNDNYAVSEFYFSHCLRRIFKRSENGHVDLRNPSLLGVDYFVIDYDGRLFPTDEARMLDRIGEVDLSIGDVWSGVDRSRRDALNHTAFNDDDPDCIHCAYQPFCGGDLVDTISRYGRVDRSRLETAFCQNQIEMFDLIFSLLSDPTPNISAALSAWMGLPEAAISFVDSVND